jgi:hypothetical protein
MTTVRVAVPRKGRPLEAVLERVADRADVTGLADDIASTLRYEKSITKDRHTAEADVYHRLQTYSDLSDPTEPEFTLTRDDRDGMPRRIVFDSVTVPITEDLDLQLVGREEPFRALRTHEFALGFDSADLVLEEVVELREEPLSDIDTLNERIDPRDTDVRVRSGLGDTVYHSLLATPSVIDEQDPDLNRAFIDQYQGPMCICPRYERLIEAVLGTSAIEDIHFCYPDDRQTEEAAIAETGIGIYLTVTGSSAREVGLQVGTRLFPSETVLLENRSEKTTATDRVANMLVGPDIETALPVN